jgi:hypothetical protein
MIGSKTVRIISGGSLATSLGFIGSKPNDEVTMAGVQIYFFRKR